MNALSHATSSMFPNNLRARYTLGLQGRPSTSLIGACSLPLSVNVGSNGWSLVSIDSFWFSPTEGAWNQTKQGHGCVLRGNGIEGHKKDNVLYNHRNNKQ